MMKSTQFKVFVKDVRNSITIGTLVESTKSSTIVLEKPVVGDKTIYELDTTNIKDKGNFLVTYMKRLVDNIDRVRVGTKDYHFIEPKEKTVELALVNGVGVPKDTVFSATVGNKVIDVVAFDIAETIITVPVDGRYAKSEFINNIANTISIDIAVYTNAKFGQYLNVHQQAIEKGTIVGVIIRNPSSKFAKVEGITKARYNEYMKRIDTLTGGGHLYYDLSQFQTGEKNV